ncbi:MAG: hypothetical protein IJL44_06935 [Bacteroidales bacterium]|nr:hypothetical protein [Bacteroidales bacterium]
MKSYLFPHRFRKAGWVISVVTILFFISSLIWFPNLRFKMPAIYFDTVFFEESANRHFFTTADSGILTICLPLLVLGLLLIGFSKEAIEDEFIVSIREKSLVWATYATAIVFVLLTLTVYGIAYTYVPYLIFFLFLVLFIIKFRIELHRNASKNEDE